MSRLKDIWAAVTTWPSKKTWRLCFLVWIVFIAGALPLGFATGFFHVRLAPMSASRLVLLPFYLFLRPALLEELIFRALLLPRNLASQGLRRLLGISLVSLTLFIVSHPLHGWLTRPAAIPLFTNPVFLSCAGLLGVACTAVYLISRSLWPPVLLHLTAVFVWLVFLGGQGLIGTRLGQ